ncbi:unnamed protein product [Pylaiella littoralis]
MAIHHYASVDSTDHCAVISKDSEVKEGSVQACSHCANIFAAGSCGGSVPAMQNISSEQRLFESSKCGLACVPRGTQQQLNATDIRTPAVTAVTLSLSTPRIKVNTSWVSPLYSEYSALRPQEVGLDVGSFNRWREAEASLGVWPATLEMQATFFCT